jgi:tetratricopeptide (TPR) repeat protein
VQYLLTGSVELRGRRLLIVASLENVDTEQRLWTEKYDVPTDDVFDVQNRLAASIAKSLVGTNSAGISSSNPSRTASTEAHIQYLMGRQSFDKGNLDGYHGAIAAYTKAIAIDPQYSTAHAGLAMAEFMLGEWTGKTESRSRAAAAADAAIRFSPGEAAGYSARGFIRLRFSWDWAGAESDLKQAIAISPGDNTALREYALLLLALGRLTEATILMQKAVDLNPLSSDDWSYLWRALSASGQNSAARNAAERAIELQADSTRALVALGTSRLLDSRAREAMDVYSRVDDPGWRLTGMAMAAHSLGDTTLFTEHLNAAIMQSSADSAYQIAEAYAWRGDSQKAFEWLERAYRQRDGGLITVKYDPLLSSLRGTPRYSALLLQLGLPF